MSRSRLSISTFSGFLLGNLKKVLAWTFAFAMLVVSGAAIINALNILAADNSWTIESDGTGLITVLKGTNETTGEVRTAYCLDPYTDYMSSMPQYTSTGVAAVADVQAILKRAYPILTPEQMGIAYLNDATLTEREAYDATQIAIWKKITNGEYEMSETLIGREFELANQIVESDMVLNEGSWITVDTSGATRANSNGTRDSYGPIKLSVNTGNSALDAAIRKANLSIMPARAERNWVFSASNAVSGAETSSIKADGTSYYINYDKASIGAISLSFGGGLADSRQLLSMEQIGSVHGKNANQLLGIVKDEPKTATATTLEFRQGDVGLNLNKTWVCANAGECTNNYSAPVQFDIYEQASGVWSRIATVETAYNTSMTPNVAQVVQNSVVLKPFTKYTVIERTLVDVESSANAIMLPVLSGGGTTAGTVGKYKVDGNTLSAAGAGESYYVGVEFMTSIGGIRETVNAQNRRVNMEITLRNVAYIAEDYPDVELPSEINYYIYSSTNGSSWSKIYGPIKMTDIVNKNSSSTDYKFTMTYGTKYRVVQDVMHSSNSKGGCDTGYVEEWWNDSYVTGSNYSSRLSSVQVLGFNDYNNVSSYSYSSSWIPTYAYGNYAGFEWTAGWSENTVLTIQESFNYNSYPPDGCEEEPPSEYDWWRRAMLQKDTVGDNPDGWSQDYKFHYETGGSLGGGTPVDVELDPLEQTLLLEAGGRDYWGEFGDASYSIWEDPISFCAGVRSEVLVSSNTINGVTTTVTKTVQTALNWRVTGSGSYSASYEYATANCTTGAIGSWSASKPSSGNYVTKITVYVGSYVQDSNIVIHAENTIAEVSRRTEYKTEPQTGVAFILKYGYDGSAQRIVATYIDGTKFKIYKAGGEFVTDWTLSAADRGKLNSISGTNAYYVTPELPAGEYYMQEVEAVAGYEGDMDAKYYFTIEPLNGNTSLSITQVRKDGVVRGTDNLGKAILNTPVYDLSVFKFKRKNLSSPLADSKIELFYKNGNADEPAYGNENLRGYTKVRQFTSDVYGTVMEGLPYGDYKLVEVATPAGYTGPSPDVAVGYPVYVGPTSSPQNNYSGVRLYIANDWVGLSGEEPKEPEEPGPEVPRTGIATGGQDGAKMNGGMIAAMFLGMGGALVLGIAMFVGKRLTVEIEENGSIKLEKVDRHNNKNVVV